MISPKVALLFGVGAGMAVALVEVAAGVGLTGNPILDGLLGGTGITLVTAGIYKYKVDRLIADIDKKADVVVVDKQFDHVNKRFDTVESALGRIESHLLNR